MNNEKISFSMIMIDFGITKDKEGLADGVYGYSEGTSNDGPQKNLENTNHHIKMLFEAGGIYWLHQRFGEKIPTDHKNNGWCNLNIKEDHQSKIQKRLNNIPWHKK